MIFRDDDARTRRRRRGARLRWWIVALIVLFGLFGLAAASSQPRDQAVERQLASDVAPTASPVQSDRRLILTFYFYWYDATTGAHLEEGSGLRHHLPSDPTPSWRNVAWHKKELADMASQLLDTPISGDYIGRLERGEFRWPRVQVRRALRQVLHAATDADLGFFIVRAQPTAIVGPTDATGAAPQAFAPNTETLAVASVRVSLSRDSHASTVVLDDTTAQVRVQVGQVLVGLS